MELILATPPLWAERALEEPLPLLDDHAHLERKAASNALELQLRWPPGADEAAWVEALGSIARDEVEHLGLVTRLLRKRGGALSRMHTNAYAAGLRRAVRKGRGPQELADRLVVAALIEARSHERFALLAMRADDELARLYRGLMASEKGHELRFLALARGVDPDCEASLRRWLAVEAEVLESQDPGPRIHSWMGPC